MKDWLKYFGVVLVVVILLSCVYVLIMRAPAMVPLHNSGGHIEASDTGEFLVTPDNKTRVYKFYDAMGATCLLAESQVDGSVSLWCKPGEE